LSIPSEYLFLCARRKFGFNKKIRRNVLIVYAYYQPNFCNTHAEHKWAGGNFLRQRKKVPPAHMQRVFLEKNTNTLHRKVWVSRKKYTVGSLESTPLLSLCHPPPDCLALSAPPVVASSAAQSPHVVCPPLLLHP
jgi:hypothetical protein